MSGALQYARKNVYFHISSPITGRFDEKKYPLVIKPLESLDNIHAKSVVLYKPAQSIGTVVLQIGTAYHLDVKRKTVLAVAQTDIDAKNFAAIKLNPFLERIDSLASTLRNKRYNATLEHWLWPTHELIISGPGINAQNSQSCCYLKGDEGHLWPAGALKALEDRMGPRFDRQALFVTTSADAGTDIDIRFTSSSCDEWHVRCVHCNGLFQPLWIEQSRQIYNGHEIFTFTESQSESETLDSLEMHCPHCDKVNEDHPRIRAEMDEGADYIRSNHNANPQWLSFRYNAFAPRWRPHRDLLAIYLGAVHSAKLGDLAPYENWTKKQLVQTWNGEFPMLGDSTRGRDYKLGDVEVVDENKLRTFSVDFQEGQKGTGSHFWALCDEFERDGSSKRVKYARIETRSQLREFQHYHGVKDKDCAADYGKQVGREIFAMCADYHWYALKSGDYEEFPHPLRDQRSGQVTYIQRPYSEARLEDPMSGKEKSGKVIVLRRGVPPGMCLSRLWSKPRIYPILYAHKQGEGHYYGIASDIGDDYTSQLHSYVPALDVDKKTGTTRKTIWRQIRKEDHAFPVSCQSLILAMIAGFFPLSKSEQTQAA